MTTRQRNLLLAGATLGLGASGASSYVHYKLLTDPTYTSFCDVSGAVSCTQAYMSQYGSFFGVPVAILGVVFFALVLLLAGIGGRPGSPSRDSVPAYVFALSTAGLAFVLYLGWASYFVLKAFCILCAITYAAVIALFVISGGATTFPMTTLPRRAMRDARTLSPVALVVILLFVVGAASAIAFFPREAAVQANAQGITTYPPLTDAQRTAIEQWWEVQPVTELPISADGAKVLIVKFSDFMCPGCRTTHDLYKGLFEKYTATGDVRYVVKHYPLEPECNPGLNGNHFSSCEAAAAEVMARPKGLDDEMTDWLFANQSSLSPDVVKKGAKEVAGIDNFDAQYATALQEVKADAALGKNVTVKSTPTYFINGRRLEGGYPPPAIEALIELELKRAAK
jgi:uncharacterized membrane protein/protein-disulfide isomerase